MNNTKYRVVDSSKERSNVDELMSAVNKYVINGWRPTGGICVANNELSYYQALYYESE